MSPEVPSIVILLSGMALIVLLILSLQGRAKRQAASKAENSRLQPESAGNFRHFDCPICNESLNPGIRVHSILYSRPSMKLMHIYGCPHCYAPPNLSQNKNSALGRSTRESTRKNSRKQTLNTRHCPRCAETIPESGYVVAELFEAKKPGGKLQVHVLGCTECRSIKK